LLLLSQAACPTCLRQAGAGLGKEKLDKALKKIFYSIFNVKW